MSDQDVESTSKSIEERLNRLEDTEAIRDLVASYAYLCDQNYDADGLAELFTEDGVWENPFFGTCRGREAIRSFFSDVSESIVWAYHIMVPIRIELASNGREASGTWYALSLSTQVSAKGPRTHDPVIATADLEKQFVKKDGRWRIQHAKATMHQVSNFDQAWVEQPFRASKERAENGK
jgi:uncharacterized protein (TIGR02246 family)